MNAGRRLLLLFAVALLGCGQHRLDLALVLARDSCTSPVPAGGSIYFLVTPGGPADGGAPSSCNACLSTPNALVDPDAMIAFLRSNAPTCSGIAPGGTLRVALTAYAGVGCSDASATPKIFCSTSPDLPVPDGHADAVASVVLTCDVGCTGRRCTPSTCQALSKNCGTVSDGCGGTLSCGDCAPPLVCGGHNAGGTPNVCSK